MIQIPMDPVYVWILVFIRTAFLIAFFPLFGEGFVPIRFRIMLAVVIALALAPVVPVTAAQFPTSLPGLAGMMASEAMLAFSLGFVGKMLFAVIQFSGQIAGEQMGFGIVNSINPTSGHQISVVAELQYLLSILLFLVSGMHHILFRALAASFALLEPGGAAMNEGVAAFFFAMGNTLFSLSLRFAMPVIITVFAINMAMAMVGRAVPQINVFLESFPLRIIGGLFVTMLGLGVLSAMWLDMFEGLDVLLAELMRILAR